MLQSAPEHMKDAALTTGSSSDVWSLGEELSAALQATHRANTKVQQLKVRCN